MSYRRFGKTEKTVSVITLGGMRFIHGWESPKEEIPRDTLDEVKFSIKRAMDCGINMIETANGYMKSEKAYGLAFEEMELPRDSYYLMTKGAAMTARDMRAMVNEQMELLKTNYFDFYGWHGMNTQEIFQQSCAPGGPVEELLKMKREGIIGHVGFSSHAPVDVISRAIETGMFDFVNLHYYYFFQRNRAAVDLAELRDMGVFIISPNDKGGQLFNAPPLLRKLTKPYTPLQWNARFCLSTPAVHTLSFGITRKSHFKEMKGIFPLSWPLPQVDREIKENMDRQWLKDPYSDYEGYEYQDNPQKINVPEFLRLRRMWKCFDMKEFGQYRYNMFSPTDHWVPGNMATPELVEQLDDSKTPGLNVKALLDEVHHALYIEK